MMKDKIIKLLQDATFFFDWFQFEGDLYASERQKVELNGSGFWIDRG